MNFSDIWLVFKTLGVETWGGYHALEGSSQFVAGLLGGSVSLAISGITWAMTGIVSDTNPDVHWKNHYKKVLILPFLCGIFALGGVGKSISSKAAQIREKPEATHFITKTTADK